MIPKENIIELTDLFNRFHWLIYLLFLTFFGSSAVEIYQMQNEIAIIENVVDRHVAEKKAESINFFKDYSFIAYKSSSLELLHKGIYPTLVQLRWGSFEASQDWRTTIDLLSEVSNTVFDLLHETYGSSISYVDLDPKLLTIGEKYSSLRSFISLEMMHQIVNTISFDLFHESCFFFRKYFDPFIQRFGDTYYVYPGKLSRHEKWRSEITVNGRVLNEDKYWFHPRSRGMHYFDIEYKFWGNYGLQTLNFRKGLMVK